MKEIHGEAARAALTDPAFVVPPVPPGAHGIAWLRASVGRFSTGTAHERRRALSVEILDRIPPPTLRQPITERSPSAQSRARDEHSPAALRGAGDEHPVATLARAMGIAEPVLELVREAAQAYRPGTGDEPRADAAVERLIVLLSGAHDEPTAARIGVLVQACDATAALIDRLRTRPPAEVFRDDPPVLATKRQATAAVSLPGGVSVEAGEEVLIALNGDLAFGAGPRRCPGRAHALALAGLEFFAPEFAGGEVAGPEFAGGEAAGPEFAGGETAGPEFAGSE